MVRSMSIVKPEDSISAEERKTRMKSDSARECLQDIGLRWFGHLERVEENAWSSECKTFKVTRSFAREQPRKIWKNVIRNGLKQMKGGNIVAKDINPWKSYRPTHGNGKQTLKRIKLLQ